MKKLNKKKNVYLSLRLMVILQNGISRKVTVKKSVKLFQLK